MPNPNMPSQDPQELITSVPGMEPIQPDPNAIKAGENIPLAPDSPAAVAFQASAQRAAENGAVVPELPAVDTPRVLDGPRETGSYTTPDGVTKVSEVTGDGMKQTRIVSGEGDQQTYKSKADQISERAAAHREAMANADPEYLKQFMLPAEKPALITEAPLTDEQRAEFKARRDEEEAAKAKQPPLYGGYTGIRVSQTPGALDSLGRPTGPVARPPKAE